MQPRSLFFLLLAQGLGVNGATTVVAITSTLVITLSTTLVIPDLPSTTSLVSSSVTSGVISVTDPDSDTTSVSSGTTVTSSVSSSGSTTEVSDPVSITTSVTTPITSTDVDSVTSSASIPESSVNSDPATSSIVNTTPTSEPSEDPTSVAATTPISSSFTGSTVAPTTEVPSPSTSVPSSDPASETTSSAEASSTALEPGLRLQVSGGDYDGYYVGNDDPAGGFGVASLYADPRDSDVFTADIQNRLIAADGSAPNYANQDADVPAQPIYFNSAAALASFMEVVYLNCLFSGDFMTCTSGARNTFVVCNPGIYNAETPTLYLNIADRVDDGCSAVTMRVVTF